jgi:hypothetical protein
LKLYKCHCSLCRKQSGTYSNAATIVPKNEFRFVRGEDSISSWVKPSGFRSDFCKQCGSPVPNLLRNTDYYWVPAGLLDGDNHLEVVSHIFLDSMVAWCEPNPHVEKHSGFPGTGLDAHIKSLNE